MANVSWYAARSAVVGEHDLAVAGRPVSPVTLASSAEGLPDVDVVTA